ncbi:MULTISPECIES: ArsR/SmtB family transcription factor [Streptomyces]|uniref:Transcriptional regulator n=1 Tax=Streptomyces viridochromogenes TaxID=1938 RepID=A0A0L8KVB9_STRVR|nr:MULTISPECIES: metalloregulator ArsR/SmtB family transcription factor [Streptomyces]KOG29654.1 transcriptional regulator [Streptomyces viridochromogenes]
MLTSVNAELLRALADPLRLRVVCLLAREPLCTTHLVEETGARQTNLSNHLRVLREAGAVETEPCGRFTYYRLRPDTLSFFDVATDRVTVREAKRARPPGC